MEIKTGMKNLPAMIPMIGLLGQIRTPLSITMCDCGRSEKESPPEKKLKLEAEADGSDLKVEDGAQNGNEESSGCDKDAFINYFQQVNKSDGFDFDEYPGSSMYTPIRPLLKSDGLPKFADEINGYASMSIKYYFGDDV
ncbi:hypothetical protein KY289_037050 [Solanum tuberosum]|nr:hypothetical protein KY289_037050 [Solanum tuberosum]